ncbi:MAG: hypothetical protein ACPLSM_08140, partial [Thermosphaera sp.]
TLAFAFRDEIGRLRYFVLDKPIIWELANDSGVDWTMYVATLKLSGEGVALQSTGGMVVLEYLKSGLRGLAYEVEVVLEEPVEVSTSRLDEVVFIPGDPEPSVELVGRDRVVKVKARIRHGIVEPLVFSNLGEALAEVSRAKMPVEPPKTECTHKGKWDELAFILPRITDLRDGKYRLASIKLMLPPGTCPDDKEGRRRPKWF